MLGFVTSLRAKSLARDWTRHLWLLERTVESMLASASSEVLVVCHDEPAISQKGDSRLTFLSVDLPVPEKTFDAMCTDKVLKLSAGIAAMKARNVAYIALCDADDLVSRRLGRFVNEHDGAAGWYTAALTMYAYGSRWVRRRVLAGTNTPPFAVIRTDLLQLQVPPFEGWWVDSQRQAGHSTYLHLLASSGSRVCPLVAAGHNNYREYVSTLGEALAPLPFDAHLMINHDDSVSTAEGGDISTAPKMFWQRARGARHWLLQLRPLTGSIRDEFGIASQLPVEHQQGSLLWR